MISLRFPAAGAERGAPEAACSTAFALRGRGFRRTESSAGQPRLLRPARTRFSRRPAERFAQLPFPRKRPGAEGGPLNRAPRISILAETIVLQAVSVMLQSLEGVTPAQYVKWHPGGALGRLRENEK